MIASDDEQLEQTTSDRAGMQTRIAALRTQIEQNKVLLPRMEALIRAIDAVKDKVALSSYWLEKLNELPLVKERRASSVRRINEIAHETIGLKAQLLELLHEQEQLSEQTSGYADLQVELAAADRSIEETRHKMADVQSEIGALHERLYRIEKRREEIAEKQDEAVRLGKKAAIYDTLKAAFSQDGIPHNIIRSMLPLLSSTANTILGQMTGGKMGIVNNCSPMCLELSMAAKHTFMVRIHIRTQDNELHGAFPFLWSAVRRE